MGVATMSERFQIPTTDVNNVRSWFANRGGALRWKNEEIGADRPDVMTPATEPDGTPYSKPHWAYGNPEPVQPDEIDVREETAVPIPDEWKPKCKACQGTGRKPIGPNQPPGWIHNPDDAGNCDCNQCGASGKAGSSVKVAVRKHYWGYDISETGKARAAKLAAKLGPDVQWTWEYEGYRLASLRFYRETIVPFTLD